jgi:hypothetical protein
MKGLLFSISFLLVSLFAAPGAQADVATVVAGEDGTHIERGPDQIAPVTGTMLQQGDLVRCLGRTNMKAFMGRYLLLFGPMSETTLESGAPQPQVKLDRGTLRVVTEPGSAPQPFVVRTPASRITIERGHVLVRFNPASEFTEVVVIEGAAAAANLEGVDGSVTLSSMESTLLSPDSPPTRPQPLREADVARYLQGADLTAAPVEGGRLQHMIDPVMARLNQAYAQTRAQYARPSLPWQAPFRTLDTHRPATSARPVDDPGVTAAPGDSNLTIRWSFDRQPRHAQ